MDTKRILRTNAFALIVLGMAGLAWAQVETKTRTDVGTPTKEVQVERGEVVYVSGNDLIVRMENGTIQHFPDVSDSARAIVDGKEIGIRDVKVGMKLQRTIATSTTPTLVTTVNKVTGTIYSVSPPNSLVLTLENGKNQKFSIPVGQKIDVDGKMLGSSELRRGMKVTATKVVTVPSTVVAQDKMVTGTGPLPPLTTLPILVMDEPEETASASELPKTGSLFPLLGLAGLLSVGMGVGLRIARKYF